MQQCIKGGPRLGCSSRLLGLDGADGSGLLSKLELQFQWRNREAVSKEGFPI